MPGNTVDYLRRETIFLELLVSLQWSTLMVNIVLGTTKAQSMRSHGDGFPGIQG